MLDHNPWIEHPNHDGVVKTAWKNLLREHTAGEHLTNTTQLGSVPNGSFGQVSGDSKHLWWCPKFPQAVWMHVCWTEMVCDLAKPRCLTKAFSCVWDCFAMALELDIHFARSDCCQIGISLCWGSYELSSEDFQATSHAADSILSHRSHTGSLQCRGLHDTVGHLQLLCYKHQAKVPRHRIAQAAWFDWGSKQLSTWAVTSTQTQIGSILASVLVSFWPQNWLSWNHFATLGQQRHLLFHHWTQTKTYLARTWNGFQARDRMSQARSALLGRLTAGTLRQCWPMRQVRSPNFCLGSDILLSNGLCDDICGKWIEQYGPKVGPAASSLCRGPCHVQRTFRPFPQTSQAKTHGYGVSPKVWIVPPSRSPWHRASLERLGGNLQVPAQNCAPQERLDLRPQPWCPCTPDLVLVQHLLSRPWRLFPCEVHLWHGCFQHPETQKHWHHRPWSCW